MGWFSEISFFRSSVDIDAWQSLGLIALDQIADIPPRIAVISDSLNLGFHSRPEFGEFWLSFESDDLRSCAEELERLGIEYVVADPSGGFARLAVTAPEGTRLVIHDSL
jgi:hypothetical protein